MAQRKRARENPSDPAVTYAVVLALIVAGGFAVWGYKNMAEKDKEKLGV